MSDRVGVRPPLTWPPPDGRRTRPRGREPPSSAGHPADSRTAGSELQTGMKGCTRPAAQDLKLTRPVWRIYFLWKHFLDGNCDFHTK